MLPRGQAGPLTGIARQRQQAPNSGISAHMRKSANCHHCGAKGSQTLDLEHSIKQRPQHTGRYKDQVLGAPKPHLFFSCSSFSILWDVTYVEKRWQHLFRSLTNSTMASSLDMFPSAAHSLLEGITRKVTSSP